MATREQLLDALRRADAAGDEAAARVIARRIKETAVEPQPDGMEGAAPAEPPPTAGSLMRPAAVASQAATEGAADVVDAVLNTPNRLLNMAKMVPGFVMQEAGEAFDIPALRRAAQSDVMQQAPDYPFARRGLSKLAELTGGSSTEFQPQTQGEQRLATIANVVGGAAAGGGISPQAPIRSLLSAVGAGGGLQTAREVAPGNMLAELAGATIGGIGGGKIADMPGGLVRLARATQGRLPDTPEADVVRLGQQRGVDVKTSDVMPPKTKAGKLAQDTGESVPVIGSGGRVQQQAQRQKAVQDMLDEYGVAPGQDFRPIVAEELLKKRGQLLTRYTGVKDSIKDRAKGVVPVGKAIQAIDSEIAQNTKVLGDQASGANQLLSEFKTVLQGKDLRTLEEARKWLGQQLDDPTRAGIKDMLGKSKDKVYGALKSDIESHVAGAVSRPAADAWRKANDNLSAMINEAEKTSLGTVLNKAEMTPEAVKQMISSLNPSDVARLNANLTSQGRAAARSAVIQKAFDSAFREGKFSEEAFNTALGKELNTSGAFFSSAQMAQAQGMRKLLSATARASKASLLPETGAKLSIPAATVALSNLLGGSTVAGLGAYGTIGALSRAYESAPVRNFLIRLSRLPPQQAAKEAQRVIPAIVAIQQEGQDGR